MSLPFLRRVALRTFARARRRPPTGNGSGTVCLFKPDAIGDFVLALSALRQLAEAHGEANCELVISTPLAGLARAEFPRARVIALPVISTRRHILRVAQSWLKWRRALAGVTADTVFCLRHHRSLEEECALLWMNARRVIGLQNSGHEISAADQAELPSSLTESAPRPTSAEPPMCLELECHRQLLRLALGREVAGEAVTPRLISAHPEPGESLLLAPFSSSAFKDYPNPLLVEALAMARPSVPLQLVGSPAQRPCLEALQALIQARCEVTVELLLPSSLGEFVHAVARARAVLTVDTAAAHVATALDKPAVILHNGTRYGEFGPWHRSARQRWMVKPLDCFGCGGCCPYPQPTCIQGIEPRAVADALTTALAGA